MPKQTKPTVRLTRSRAQQYVLSVPAKVDQGSPRQNRDINQDFDPIQGKYTDEQRFTQDRSSLPPAKLKYEQLDWTGKAGIVSTMLHLARDSRNNVAATFYRQAGEIKYHLNGAPTDLLPTYDTCLRRLWQLIIGVPTTG
ncbi:hypothetical protein O1611_g7224 [Lasiodiplodia mahajangana]|uniref:Uncharacterized protein n=1 Tax=Lasiodiplodia mahajangana TaxID=1108764 RepID=A0ACC2JGB3_9PEZI|nr:hypothetical protein O1611_g7224 [Lasiodiplodia mahajangana]